MHDVARNEYGEVIGSCKICKHIKSAAKPVTGDPGMYELDFACSLPDHECRFEEKVDEKVDESCDDYKLYRSISGNAKELLNLISDELFAINKGGDKVKGLALIEGYLEGFQMLMNALRYIDPPANFGDKEGE